MGRVPSAGRVFFPLDEELELLPGNLAPRQQEHLVHLACFMPFDKAAEMMGIILSVQTNEEMARRLTERVGSWMEAAQTTEVEAEDEPQSEDQQPMQRCVFSADGAMVSLVHKQWAETRTVAIGEPQVKVNAKGEREIHVVHLSYFSRLADALTFTKLAEVEMRRRRVAEAKEVSAVMDGADWCQMFTDKHRPDAVRILDFPHGAEHTSKLLEALENTGMRFPSKMLERCLHILKHRGPRPLLRMANRLESNLAQQRGVNTHLDYLRKRETLMQYPEFRQKDWPIGSGMVESANKNVVEARLKGTGMHWERKNVNPMLTLRNAVCNGRWQEMWQKALNQYRKQQALQRSTRLEQRAQARLTGGNSTSTGSPQSGPEAEPSTLSPSPTKAITLPSPSGPCAHRNDSPHRDAVSPRVKGIPQRSSETRSEVCLYCGTPLVQSGGRTRRYCSDSCRARAYYQRQANATSQSLPDSPTLYGVSVSLTRSNEVRQDTCLFCGICIKQAIGGRRTRRYCSDSCRVRAYYQRRGRSSPLSTPLDGASHGINVSPTRSTDARQDTCLCCGIPLVQSRSRTKCYCSDRCRVRAYQKRQAKMS
jgi:hypothetical protein